MVREPEKKNRGTEKEQRPRKALWADKKLMEKQMVRKTEKKNGGTEKEQRQRKGSREKERQKDRGKDI